MELSTAGQLTETVDRHFCGQDGLLIVAITLEALGEAVRWEASRKGQLFPHLYGQLGLEHVAAVRRLERHADGTVLLPTGN